MYYLRDMQELKIEILNPKALKLIKDLQDLDLIKITEGSASGLKAYLKKMRGNSNIPSLKEITAIVEEVRTVRHARK